MRELGAPRQDDAVHFVDQVSQVKWLPEEIDSAHLLRRCRHIGSGSRHDYDRYLYVPHLQLLHELPAIDQGHSEIEDEQCGFLGLEREERIHSIPGRSRVVARMAQTLCHHLAEGFVIIDNENGWKRTQTKSPEAQRINGSGY
jgi:hypothetical protein